VTRRCGLMHLRLPNSPQRMVPPYSSTEVATAMGVSLDTFYRTRQIRALNPGARRRDQPFIPSLRTCNSSRSMPASARSALRAR
jgi:hypothetical protein